MRKTAFSILILALLVLGASLTGCDPYHKLAKSNKIADKDSAAVAYYNLKKYDRAVYLFEELVPIYSGTPRAEEMYFYYAYCRYYLGELVSANFHFEDFAKKYPGSTHAEEFEYMAAKTFHMLSDPYYLDQAYTEKAIDQYQLFLSRHPYTPYKDKCMDGLRELRERLAKKAFEQCNLYLEIGYNKAAVESFQNMINKFPDSGFREEAQYLIIKAADKFAAESIESKKTQRYTEALALVAKFEEKFPSSTFAKDVAVLKTKLNKDYEDFQADQALKTELALYNRLKVDLDEAENNQSSEIRKSSLESADATLSELRAKYPQGKHTAQALALFDKFESKNDDK
jgi:outer membrane protein assembly factor BamD